MPTQTSARPEQSDPASAGESQSTTHLKENNKPRFGPATPSNVIRFLCNRAKNLDVDELEFLSGAADYASHMGFNLAETVSNIGCVISWDDQPGKVAAGNFTIGENVSSLLFVIADQMRVISELTQIADDAASTLRYRERRHD